MRSSGERGRGFRVRFRGFDRTEVIAALAKLGSENEEARREIERLGSEIDRLQSTVEEQFDSARHVQRALISASQVAEDIRVRAEEDARRIVRDAEEQGAMVVQRFRDEAHTIEGQIES